MDDEHGRFLEYVGRPAQGSKDPIFIDCLLRSTNRRQGVIVKPSSDPGQQAREFLGNKLARAFGLQTPKPLIVQLEDEDLDALRKLYQREQRFFPRCVPELAGAYRVPLGTNIPLNVSLDPDLFEPTTRLFTFDMLTHYADRTESNPNCSWNGHGLLVFDFEQCFPTEPRLMDAGPAWRPCSRGLANLHCLYRHLRGRRADLGFLPDAVGRLTGKNWRNVVDGLPDTWREESLRILEHIEGIANHLDDFCQDLRSVLP
jgi:hypothetical protein